jgi:polar amino acid transport system substrate-binding protein
VDTLRVGVALPDPPFNGVGGSIDSGLDVDLIHAIGAKLGLRVRLIAYDGADFDGIFDQLKAGAYDCVIAGTAVTPARERKAAFAPPYLISGQSLAVDTERFPSVRSIDDLTGMTVGVQHGSTSQPIAERLVAEGKAETMRVYGDVRSAWADLTTGDCDAFIELAPVLADLVKDARGVEVVQRGISWESIAIAVAIGEDSMLQRITAAQADLEADGTLQGMRRRWLGNPYRDQSLAAH